VWGLATIKGRVNVVLDIGRVLSAPSPSLPCWMAALQTKGAKWGVAASDEWSVLSRSDVAELEDHTPPPGPPGLVAGRVRFGNETVHVLSVDKLAELAGARERRRGA